MCHVNDALACPSEGIAKQKSSVLIHLPAGHALAAASQIPSFDSAGVSQFACPGDPDHGAQQ